MVEPATAAEVPRANAEAPDNNHLWHTYISVDSRTLEVVWRGLLQRIGASRRAD